MEKIQLYPERDSIGVAEKVAELKSIIEGEAPQWEIPGAERERILEIENNLGERLESIVAIKGLGVEINLNYLATPEGKVDFEEKTGVTLPESDEPMEVFRKVLYRESETLQNADLKSLKKCSANSISYREETLQARLEKTMTETGEVDTSNVEEFSSLTIRLDSEKDAQKAAKLREIKVQIKTERAKLTGSEMSEGGATMLDELYGIYQSRINELIAGQASVLTSYYRKQELLGEDSLADSEKAAVAMYTGNNPEKRLARYDKFLYGTENESDTEGWKQTVGSELQALADELEEKFIEVGLHKDELLKEKGLSKEAVLQREIPVAEVQKHCENALAHYDLLSSEPASEYDPKRKGPASDGKWQVIVSDSYKSLSVEGLNQKIIKCPNKPQTVERLLSVSIAHEIEAHALQHHNRSQIPLRLLKKIGGGRSSNIAEGGAVRNENYVTETAFGYPKVNHPHYVRAMIAKLEGGNYNQVLEAYYHSAIKVHQLKLREGKISQDEFKSACSNELKIAINRAGRQFRGDADRNSSSAHLAESKATSYIEQTKLAAELQKAGLEDVLNYTEVNLPLLTFLAKAGMIDFEKIKKPDFYSLELWKEMEPSCKLNSEET